MISEQLKQELKQERNDKLIEIKHREIDIKHCEQEIEKDKKAIKLIKIRIAKLDELLA